jgi:hypothetical protein
MLIKAKWLLYILTGSALKISKVLPRGVYEARSQKCEKRLSASSCLSVHIEEFGTTGRILMTFDIGAPFRKSLRENSGIIKI